MLGFSDGLGTQDGLNVVSRQDDMRCRCIAAWDTASPGGLQEGLCFTYSPSSARAAESLIGL